MTFRLFPLSALLVLVLAMTACDSSTLTGLNPGGADDDDPTNATTPTLNIRLTDAPGDYEEVLIDVADVQIRYDGEWIDLDDDFTGQYDLLELSNGVDTLLASSDIPAGTLTEVRLILGDENYIRLNGDDDLTELRTPSAQQSGLKIQIENGEIVPGQAYEILLDFDACRSIVRAGNSGNYNLRPVLRASFEAVDAPTTGEIVGLLNPAEEQYVFAYQMGGDTIGTTSDSIGTFRLVGLAAGVYTFEVTPPDSATYAPFLQENISVEAGAVTNLGTIDL